jgi:hypothetical protein
MQTMMVILHDHSDLVQSHWGTMSRLSRFCQQTPALRTLEQGNHFSFLDSTEKPVGEKKRGDTGKNKHSQGLSGKACCDIKKCQCNHVEKKAREAGMNIDNQSLDNVRKTFAAAEKEIHGSGKRNSQLKWGTESFQDSQET